MRNYTLKKSNAEVYAIRIKDDCTAWADITLESWKEGGSIKVISDYGDYTYMWNSIGSGSFKRFLCGLDYNYFMGKCRGHHGQQFSAKMTIQYIRSEIVTARRAHDLDKDTARASWNLLNDKDYMGGESEFCHFLCFEGSKLVDDLYHGDISSIPYGSEPIPECVGFWDIIWPIACDIWKHEEQLEAQTG
jgi:hypothetical protein